MKLIFQYAVFQTSAPFPSFVEMAGELKNCEATETFADTVVTKDGFPEKVKQKIRQGLRLLEVI